MDRFESYQEMRQRVGELYRQQAFEQVVEILKWGLRAFPDHLKANVFNLALCQVQISQMDQALETLKFGLEHGVWFGPFELENEAWEPIKGHQAFGEIQARYEMLMIQAQEQAEPLLELVPPIEYSPQRAYPLFIALHGGGETVETFKRNWTAPILRKEFIVAYPQSSRVISMDGYSWMGEPPDQQEIKDTYRKTGLQYNVDSDCVIVGGFSSGGHLALTLLMEEVLIFPCRGFVVLCPPVPDGISIEKIERMVELGQRGVLLTTEMDPRLKDQEKFALVLESAGVPLRFEVFPNIGHWYPPDLDDKIHEAVDFVFQTKEYSGERKVE